MAVDAGNMKVLIQQHGLMGAVRCVPHRKRMTIFGRHHFRKNIGDGGRDIGATVVAVEAGLVVNGAQQRVLPLDVMLRVARRTTILGNRGVRSQGCLSRAGGGPAGNPGAGFRSDLGRHLVCRGGVDARRPLGKRIGIARRCARGKRRPTTAMVLWLASRELLKPIPDPVGIVLWQARQSALLELLITRKFGLFGSVFCT